MARGQTGKGSGGDRGERSGDLGLQKSDSEAGPGGQKGMPMLIPGKDGSGQAQMLLPGQGAQAQLRMGSGAGKGGKPQSGDPSDNADHKHVDAHQTGEHGQGRTRSEVILEAASRGFASREYKEVAQEYKKHAESALEHDDIPGGYRFYVRRYFQLIRPREANP
jgi:hypothetical protein